MLEIKLSYLILSYLKEDLYCSNLHYSVIDTSYVKFSQLKLFDIVIIAVFTGACPGIRKRGGGGQLRK